MKSTSKLKILDFKFIIFLYLVWRIFLLLSALFTKNVLPLQNNFLGGGMQNYLSNPLLWGMANFDGEHYLSLAKFGYQPLTYFFFPLYPLIISTLSSVLGKSEISYIISGNLVSNISFLAALFGLYKLAAIEFNKKIALYSLIVLLLFPTSFYFAAVYTESLFLALVVWSFYFAREKNWFLAASLAALASATRVVGVVLLPGLLVEYWLQNKNQFKVSLNLIYILISVFGLVVYMFYLYKTTGDPLTFLHTVGIYGDQRSSTLILLPQVFYRYIFKILPVVGLQFSLVSLVSWIELTSGVVFIVLSFIALFKLRLSWAIYGLGVYLIPTLSGSFSSMPRYVLIIFPAFVLLAVYIEKLRLLPKIILGIASILLLVVLQSMFLHGLWVS